MVDVVDVIDEGTQICDPLLEDCEDLIDPASANSSEPIIDDADDLEGDNLPDAQGEAPGTVDTAIKNAELRALFWLTVGYYI